jgi:hypothetical protein
VLEHFFNLPPSLRFLYRIKKSPDIIRAKQTRMLATLMAHRSHLGPFKNTVAWLSHPEVLM